MRRTAARGVRSSGSRYSSVSAIDRRVLASPPRDRAIPPPRPAQLPPGPASAAPRRILLHRYDLQKVHHAQPAAHPRQRHRWQRVVRPGNIVAHRLRRISPNEHRARIAHPLQIGFAVNGQVLRSQPVGDLARLLHCHRNDGQAIARDRLSRQWDSSCTRRFTSATTARASVAVVVTSIASARDRAPPAPPDPQRSPTASPFSLVTTISVGPASMSMAQSKATSFLAAVTICSCPGQRSCPRARMLSVP